jgi:hypothetical protein
MEIQSLRVLVREDEINRHLPRVVPPDAGVENLRVRFVPEGVIVAGEYPTFMLRVSFETLWEVAAAAGKVQAKLASVKVGGLPAKLLRGVLMKAIRDAAANQPGLHVDEEAVSLDPARVLAAHNVPVEVYLTAVRPGPGHLLIEAGAPLA